MVLFLVLERIPILKGFTMDIRELNGNRVLFCCYGKHCRKAAKRIKKAVSDNSKKIVLVKSDCMKKCGKKPVFFLAEANGGRFILEGSAEEICNLLETP